MDKSKLDSQPKLFIHIIPDKNNNMLTIVNSGIGMTKAGRFGEAMFSKIILMMPKTQVNNQESSKFQESKSHSIKTRSIKNQDSSKKNQEKTQLR